jgi:hypothetical protein
MQSDVGPVDGVFGVPKQLRAGGDELAGVARALRAHAAVLDRLLSATIFEDGNGFVYGDELMRARHSAEQRLLGLVRGLLAGDEQVDLDTHCGGVDGAGLVGYELGGEHVGVVARGAGAREALRGLAGRLDRRLLCVECGEGVVWAWLGGGLRLEMAALELALTGMQPGGVVFAVGEPARGLAGWRLTHQQAQAALVVALRRHDPRPEHDPRPGVSGVSAGVSGVTRYADVALLASALKDEGLASALIEIYVEPLEDSRGGGPALRETLRAYLAAERSTSSAAAALGVDRKTVASRLRTIEKRLGRSLHPCPAELEIALLIDELAPAPPPPEIPIV